MSQANGKVALVEKKFAKVSTEEKGSKLIRKDLPQINTGDTVRVHVKIKEGDKERIQAYEGTVLAFNNSGTRRTITVRKISHGVGVERVFPIFSPTVAKIERLDAGHVRRSKIYYLRGLAGKAAKVRSETDVQ